MNGTTVRQSLETRDYNDAMKKLAEFERKGELPQVVGKTTIDEWREKYLQNAQAEKLSGETIRKYEHLFRQIAAFAQSKGLRYVEEFDLDVSTQFRATWKDAPLSASKKLERLRSIVKFALKRKWITDAENSALELKKPKVESKETLPFTDDEMVRILKTAKEDRSHGNSASSAANTPLS